MTPIGGFFELELGKDDPVLHAGATALTSGRACLNLLMQKLRPRRAFVPFYTCDSVVEPLVANGISVDYYSVSETLDPVLPRALSDDECVIYINYFGLKGETASRVATAYGSRAIIDDTQAFFASGYPAAWSFNSARKVFGVPDGGYLYGPLVGIETYSPNADVRCDYLVNRLLGHQELAFAQYKESEHHVCMEVRGISELSTRLLGGIDYIAVKAARRRNFALLRDRFDARNQLRAVATSDAGDAPFCYPLLPDRRVVLEKLWAASVFIPRLWPDVLERPTSGFAWERQLSERLLPLPIDHRYGEREMTAVANLVEQAMG